MKTEVKYGLITGVGICVWILLEYALGFHTTNLEIGRYTGYASMVIPVLALFFGIRAKRDKDLKGTMTFWQGVGTGFGITIIAAIIITAFLYLYITVINPGWTAAGLEYERQRLTLMGMNEGQITARMQIMQQVLSAPVQTVASFIGTIINGLLISMIIAAFMRKKA